MERKDNSHMRLKLLAWVSIFTFACGAQAALPVYEDTQPPTQTSTAVNYPAMVVTADTLHVRECAGTGCAVIDGAELRRGDVVTCYEYEGNWCRHEKGWSNARYMEAR